MDKDLFGNEIKEPERIIKNTAAKINPMLKIYGHSDGRKCKYCVHFIVKKMGNKYFKCALRKITNGPATDHRANWPACGKFEIC